MPLYQPPAAWVKPIPIPEGKVDRDGAAAQVLLQNIQTHFAAEHDDYFVEQAIKIRAAQGLQEWGNVIIPWRPDTETLVFHKLNILRDGKVIDALAGRNKVTILRREQNLEMAMLDGSLTATIQPEGLQVGDVLDMAYTRQVHDPVMKGRSQDWTFLARPGVVERAYLRATWPKTKPVRWHATEGLGQGKLADTAEGRELVFDLATAEAPHPPRGAPVRFAYLAEVQMTDFTDWADVSTLSEPLYTKASTLATDSPLRAEIARIAAASADPKVRAALALKLVQDKVRYLFLGLNNGGYIPADADVTWTRRFGDCKAKTALLLALLKGLGIDAQPGLVNTKVGDGLSERLPTLTAFDHVAVRARIGGRSYWLDGTRLGDGDLDSLPTPNYHWMLPVQKTGAVLEKLQPDAYAEPHWESHLRLDATAGLDKPASAHAEHVFRGEEGVTVRQDLEAQGRADQERNMRNYWRKQLPWVEPSRVTFSVDDKHNPVLTMDGDATLNWSHDSDGRNFFVSDSGIGGQTNFKRDPGPGQDAPFSVDFPFFDKRTVTITLPDKGAGFVLINANPISTVVAGIDYHRTTRMDQGVVQIETTRRAVAQEFAVSETSAASMILRDWAQHSVGVRLDAGMAKAGADGVDCGSTTPAISIAGCTRIIAAGKLGAAQMAATYFNRGQAYFGQGDWDRAIADYTQAITIKPDMAEAFNSRGAAYGRKQLPEQAIKDYGEAIRLNGKVPLYWMNRGFAYATRNKIDAAISDFSQILSIDPNYGPALIARGLAYDVLRDPDHAIADFDRALKLDPTNAAVMVDRGRDYAGKNDWVHAMLDFDLAVRTRADYADGYAARGAAFFHDRQFNRALEDDDAAIRLKPGAANFWLARGMVYVQLDNVQHAIADYDEAIRLDSRDATAFYERAFAYARTKDYEHAIQDYSDAIRLRFNYEPALRGRAAAFGQVGQWSRAVTDYTAVLAIKPNDRLL